MKKRDDLQIDVIKDYIEHPKPSGYRSLHLIVRTKVYLAERVIWVPAEIQIRTLAMDFWAATEHKLQYKYQHQIPDASRQELIEAARMADALDTQMGRIREQILI
ncbi:GTP pyrophosphokinase ywaC [Exiguobacterium sp. S17]|nr:GTP pyrophosphokinase ywaC [Exiguobacterium sp. S17]